MLAESILVRTYTDHDLEAYRHLYTFAASEREEALKMSPHFINTILARPSYSPQQDLFVLEKEEQELIGFIDIFSEIKIKRVILDGFVHPDYRRQGLAVRLLESGLARSQEIGADLVHVCVREDNRASRQFLSAWGFIPKRIYLELERGIQGIKESRLDLDSGSFGKFQEGQEALLAQVQNKVFSGSWGFCPNTAADIKYYLRLTGTRMEEVTLIEKANKVIGYLWPQVYKLSGGQAGRIHMFGIVPEFQERGLGKQLMMFALVLCKQRNLETVGLTVDELNRPAVALYKSLGFRVKARKVWYEKRLK